jgi:hypothetical protein
MQITIVHCSTPGLPLCLVNEYLALYLYPTQAAEPYFQLLSEHTPKGPAQSTYPKLNLANFSYRKFLKFLFLEEGGGSTNNV